MIPVINTRKIPQRMCVGCREMKSKRELIRVVRTPEGQILLDATGKKSGRGAYVCPMNVCLEKAIKSKALQRALQTEIAPDIYQNLRGQIDFGSEQ